MVDRRFSIYPGANSKEANTKVRNFNSRWHPVQQVGNNQDQRIVGAGGSVGGIYGREGYSMLSDLVDYSCTAMQLGFTGVDGKDTQGKEPRYVKRRAMQRVIAGEHDDMYRNCFTAMSKSPFPNIILRLGSEGDIPWPPHSFVPGTDGGRGNDDIYRQAYRYVRSMAIAILGRHRVKFVYTTTVFAGGEKMLCADNISRTKLEAGFPGKLFVDYIGVDFYLNRDSLDKHKSRFAKHVAFAQSKGLPLVIDEWGITPDGHDHPTQTQVDFVRFVDSQTSQKSPYISFFAGWAASKFPDDYSIAARDAIKNMKKV
jgi:hypothetical protein